MIGYQGYYEWKAGRWAGLELNAYAARDIALGQAKLSPGPHKVGRRGSAVQAFSSGTKTLAEGGFTPPEHRKKWGPRKAKLSGADNAAMIGCQGYYEWKDGRRAGLELNAYTARDIALEQCPGAV